MTAADGLDLGVVGNCQVSALADSMGRVVWMCLPNPHGDPVFSSQLTRKGGASADGVFAVDLVDFTASEQTYTRNGAILETVPHDSHGGSVKITDFCPRFRSRGRNFRPTMLARLVEPLAGRPIVRIRLRPARDLGAQQSTGSPGSHHLVHSALGIDYRITTDASISALSGDRPIVLDRPLTLVFGGSGSVNPSSARRPVSGRW